MNYVFVLVHMLVIIFVGGTQSLADLAQCQRGTRPSMNAPDRMSNARNQRRQFPSGRIHWIGVQIWQMMGNSMANHRQNVSAMRPQSQVDWYSGFFDVLEPQFLVWLKCIPANYIVT